MFTTNPSTATGNASPKSTGTGDNNRLTASTAIHSAATPSRIALANPASAKIFPVPNTNPACFARVRANQYAAADIPRAPACVAMCHPSAVSANDPLSRPTMISANITTTVIAMTTCVRRSLPSTPT